MISQQKLAIEAERLGVTPTFLNYLITVPGMMKLEKGDYENPNAVLKAMFELKTRMLEHVYTEYAEEISNHPHPERRKEARYLLSTVARPDIKKLDIPEALRELLYMKVDEFQSSYKGFHMDAYICAYYLFLMMPDGSDPVDTVSRILQTEDLEKLLNDLNQDS